MKVRAFVHPDERGDLAAEFDAAEYLSDLDDSQIQGLLDDPDYNDETDDIARWAEDKNEKVAAVFNIISGYNELAREPIGFGCYLNAEDLTAWVKTNRPGLVPE